MHTSSVLASTDFEYWETSSEGHRQISFEAFCPDYHELDRTAVITPVLEDGVLHTGYALLGMTTNFYDIQKSRSNDFFIYPQHFVIMDMNDSGVVTRKGRLSLDLKTTGGPWANLDVWPESKWYGAPGTALGMLQKILDLQINRLFWPEDLLPAEEGTLLPAYGFKNLQSVLKAVWFYDAKSPNMEVRANQNARDVIQESLIRLPNLDADPPASPTTTTGSSGFGHTNGFKKTTPNEFLTRMKSCFADT